MERETNTTRTYEEKNQIRFVLVVIQCHHCFIFVFQLCFSSNKHPIEMMTHSFFSLAV